MPADLLDRLQEDKLHGLERLIGDYQAGVDAGGVAEGAAAIADFFVDEGIGLRQSSVRLWDYYWSMALAGKVADRPGRGTKLRSLLERTGLLLARHVAAARTYADASGEAVARLELLEDQCRAFPLWVEECMARWELLDRPRKSLDRDRIAAAQTEFVDGKCESVTEIIARLQNGGSLVQE